MFELCQDDHAIVVAATARPDADQLISLNVAYQSRLLAPKSRLIERAEDDFGLNLRVNGLSNSSSRALPHSE
jgi:hypothetical protein